MPLFPDIINRAGVSFHVFWWKGTVNQTCFWADCKTSMKFDSQSKNVPVEWLGLHHGGAAKETQMGGTSSPHRCSFLQLVATRVLPRGLQDAESGSPGPGDALLHLCFCSCFSQQQKNHWTWDQRGLVQLLSSVAAVEENKRAGKGEEKHIWRLVHGSVAFTSSERRWERKLPCGWLIGVLAQGGAVGLGREGKVMNAKSNTGKRMWILQEKPATGERGGTRVVIWRPGVERVLVSWHPKLGNVGMAGLCGWIQSLMVCPFLEPSCTIFMMWNQQ